MTDNIMQQPEEILLEDDTIDYEEIERQLEENAQQELYNIIINKTSKLDLDSLMTKKKPEHNSSNNLSNIEIRQKPSKFISLNQLNSKMDEFMPKKFISKRADAKRKDLGIEDAPQYRKFNARKQPYNFVNKLKRNQVISMNNTEFPSL